MCHLASLAATFRDSGFGFRVQGLGLRVAATILISYSVGFRVRSFGSLIREF